MITVHSEKCSRCGLCAELCHESCISLTDDGPSIDRRVQYLRSVYRRLPKPCAELG